ncbi:MAG: hypothetical protein ACLQU4_05090, partial [Limisphaerales bacterium]
MIVPFTGAGCASTGAPGKSKCEDGNRQAKPQDFSRLGSDRTDGTPSPPYPRKFFEKYFTRLSVGTGWLTAGSHRKRAKIDFSHFSDFMVLFFFFLV